MENFPKGIHVIYGVRSTRERGPKGGRTNIQSFLFDKKLWTKSKARGWLDTHGFKFGKIHETSNFFIFRQMEPERFVRYRAIRHNPERDLDLLVSDFVKIYGQACGGNWSKLLMSAIKNGLPEVYEDLNENRSYTFKELYDIIEENIYEQLEEEDYEE